MNSRKVRFVALITSTALVTALLAGCGEQTSAGQGTEAVPEGLRVLTADPMPPVLVLGSSDPAELALTASQAFFRSAPVVVLVPATDESAQNTAAAAATSLNAPVLLTGGSISESGLAKEIERLGAVAAVVVTPEPPVPVDAIASAGTGLAATGTGEERKKVATATAHAVDPALDVVLLDADSLVATPDGGTQIDERDFEDVQGQLPDRRSPQLLSETLALVDDVPGQTAAIATAQAAGVVPLTVPGGDPRASSESVQALARAKALVVVGIGARFGSVEELTARVRAAETGVEIAGGGQLVTAGKRYVVLPSVTVPSTPAKIAEVVDTVEATATPYGAQADGAVVVPTVELTVTEVSGAAGKDGNFSTELTSEAVRPAVDAALAAGQHVLLEIQPGRSTFVQQVERYADLLALPGVGVSLDLDARRTGGGVKKDGEVPAEEIEAVADYLTRLAQSKALPQKLLVVHASSPRSVTGLGGLESSDAVALVVHSDVAGSVAARTKAWEALGAGASASLWWGWTDLPSEAADGANRAAAWPVPSPLVVVVE